MKRNDNGLIDGLEYPKKANGRINWRALIDNQYIVFNESPKLNEEIVAKYGAPAEKLVYSEVIKSKSVDEHHILIQLAGFVELADLRGYISAPVEIVHVTPDQNVTAQCHITWLPNEEEPYNKTSSGEADATMGNTGGFGYLAAMAGNRAFVRAVKRGLGISILGFDELAKKDQALTESLGAVINSLDPLSPQGILQKTASAAKLDFEKIKKTVIDHHRAKIETDPTTWNKFEEVPPRDCMTIIGLLGEREKAK